MEDIDFKKLGELLHTTSWELYIGTGMSKDLYNFENVHTGFITHWFNDSDILASLQGDLIAELETLEQLQN